MSFKIKFWGVRGSIACPSAKYIIYGGNTSCVEVSCGGHRLVFDCGTGIRNLGHYLIKKGTEEIDVLMSHTHWDHINGFPFFSPAFRDDFSFTIHAGHLLQGGMNIRDVMAGQMVHPVFPVPMDAMHAKLTFQDFSAGDQFTLGAGIVIKTAPLNHPDGATGYRVEYGGHVVCYVTDTNHTPGQPNTDILALIQGADIVIYDSTYTDEEFPNFADWGHSTWQEGARLCDAAGAKTLVIFHHDPSHDDAFMDRVAAEADQARPGTVVAREGLVLTP